MPFYDVSDSDDPVQKAREMASSIQHTPMPFTDVLLKFALFQTRPDEFYFFMCHHIALDGTGMALVGRRIATVYSALVAGEPISPAYFGSLQDLVVCESGYEASTDFLDDQAYWSAKPAPGKWMDHGLPHAAGERDPNSFCAVSVDPSVVGQIKRLSKSCGSVGTP